MKKGHTHSNTDNKQTPRTFCTVSRATARSLSHVHTFIHPYIHTFIMSVTNTQCSHKHSGTLDTTHTCSVCLKQVALACLVSHSEACPFRPLSVRPAAVDDAATHLHALLFSGEDRVFEADTDKFDEDVTSADGLADPVEVVIVLVLFPVISPYLRVRRSNLAILHRLVWSTALLPCLLLDVKGQVLGVLCLPLCPVVPCAVPLCLLLSLDGIDGSFPSALLRESSRSSSIFAFFPYWCEVQLSYIHLNTSECTCSVAVDATFPEVTGHSTCETLGSTLDTISSTVPGFSSYVLMFSALEVDSRASLASRYGEVCTVDASFALWFHGELGS